MGGRWSRWRGNSIATRWAIAAAFPTGFADHPLLPAHTRHSHAANSGLARMNNGGRVPALPRCDHLRRRLASATRFRREGGNRAIGGLAEAPAEHRIAEERLVERRSEAARTAPHPIALSLPRSDGARPVRTPHARASSRPRRRGRQILRASQASRWHGRAVRRGCQWRAAFGNPRSSAARHVRASTPSAARQPLSGTRDHAIFRQLPSMRPQRQLQYFLRLSRFLVALSLT